MGSRRQPLGRRRLVAGRPPVAVLLAVELLAHQPSRRERAESSSPATQRDQQQDPRRARMLRAVYSSGVNAMLSVGWSDVQLGHVVSSVVRAGQISHLFRDPRRTSASGCLF